MMLEHQLNHIRIKKKQIMILEFMKIRLEQCNDRQIESNWFNYKIKYLANATYVWYRYNYL